MKLASSKTISNYLMPNIYFDFLSKYPIVKFDISTINSTRIIEDLINSKLDLGLIETDVNNPIIIKEKILEDELIIVTSDKTTPKELFIDNINKKWILRENGSGTREIFVNTLGKYIKEIDIFMELQDFEEIKTILLHNKNTVSAISKYAVQKELKSKKLFEIKLKNFKFKRNLYLIYHKDKSKNLLFNTFIEFLKNRFETKA